jgi:hypothetical protein
MRFHADGPPIPDGLLDRRDEGRVVFLCGAGVSIPSGMPSFIGLTQHIIEFFDPPKDSGVMRAFQPWLDDPSGPTIPLDQVFNLLHQEYGKTEVNALVMQRLTAPSATTTGIGYHHSLIKRISSSLNGIPQVVTTNFDTLFELNDELAVHIPPAFPDLAFGASIEGITYLHGRLAGADEQQHSYVLSSADFGRAYLSEAWATNFIRNLLDRYTVVLVGYQAEDPPIKYLLQGLNHDGQYDRSRLFAFDIGRPEDVEAKWRDRGVSAIAYADHDHFWQTMAAWAERADNPRDWRASVIQTARRDPKSLLSHERGQVAHVLRSVQGAKLFSEIAPPAHPEWICVMDANVRSAKKSKGYGENAETFYPMLAYGLDDDLKHIADDDYRRGVSNENLLMWRYGDDNPPTSHRLTERQTGGYEFVPPRLLYLSAWIGKSIESPTLAWWAARQNGLHPSLLQQIEWQIEQRTDLHKRARHSWGLILEHHRDHQNQAWDGRWFAIKKRIAREGWTSSVLRDFRRICNPRLRVTSPYGIASVRPPEKDWDLLSLGHLGKFEIKFLERHNENLEVPDEVLPQVFGILQDQFVVASGLLGDIENQYFKCPTCYPNREVDGENYHSGATSAAELFLHLFDRLAVQSPSIARGHALTWPVDDRFFFRKFKIYALAKISLFDANEAACHILNFEQEVFWDSNNVRELLFLMSDRWTEFTTGNRQLLVERILNGPDQFTHWPEDEYEAIRARYASTYGRYLELQGCELCPEQSRKLSQIISGIENWNDGWAASIVKLHGSYTTWVGTDEAPDVLLSLPANEIIPRARNDLEREFRSFTEKRPFTGLVKTSPRKALAALTSAGKKGDYPEPFWSAIINEMPDQISPRLKRVFLKRLTKLPRLVVHELRHTLAPWIEKKLTALLDFDHELGWAVFDHVMDGLLDGGEKSTESGLGQIHQGGQVVEQSLRTYDYAINGPIGMCTEALFQAVPGETQEAGSLIPEHIKERIGRLLSAPGEGADHAVSITTSKLNWLMYVDPNWTEKRFVPMLAFDHHMAEPAWNGFLSAQNVPSRPLVRIIKPLLLELFPWINQQAWDTDYARTAAQWLGWTCIFRQGTPEGLTNREMRGALRLMPDDVRNSLIFWLGKVGQKNENGWEKLVVPFLQSVWPRERVYRTSSSVNAWIGLLDDTGGYFPVVYYAVKQFLVPIESSSNPLYRFARELNGETPITTRFPEDTLDLIDTVTPRTLTRLPYELPKVVSLIAEVAPKLRSDRRYLRLIDLIERS